MIRGQSHNDCYLVSLRRNIVDGTPRLTFRVDKRRKGYTKPLTGIAIEDFQIATPVKQRMAIEMDGKNFAARLEWTERNQLGWEQTESRVIHTWKDDSYRQGAVGLYGPQRPRNGGDGEFRIFSVQVEG